MSFPKIILLSFIVIIGTLIPSNSKAQYFVLGQDPASISWKQINSPYFKIIFPSGYEKKAQEYINLLELSRPNVSLPYLHSNKKVKIVLHNRSVISNAMVSPTPMHADFFEMPDQSTYAQTWAKQLTLHEYRHVVQMQKLNQGTTKVLKYMFGDQAIGAIMGIFLPMWFIEGDAVFSETIFSESGRGRSPNFTMDLKAQVLNKKIYPYDKALYGSYRNYVPNHYTLGYQLVLEGIASHNPDMWNNVLNKVARQPYMLFPFTKSIKNTTGKYKVGYYHHVLNLRKKQWAKTDSSKSKYPFIIPQKNKYFSNYRFVNYLNDSSFIVEKSGIDDINRFVKVDKNGTEKILFTPGYDFNESLSANDSLLCWNEKTYDPRWKNRTYSVIKIYNYKSKKLKQITKRSRLFAPSLANTSSKLVAVNVTENNQYSLQIIDIKTGDVLKEFSVSDNLFFMTPKWSQNDNHIVCTVLGKKGKSIIMINTKSWEYEFLLPTSFTDISQPAKNGNSVIFTGAYLGTDDLYLIDLSTKDVLKLTNVRFGASASAFAKNTGKVYFSNYTDNGFRISNVDINLKNAEKVNISNLKPNFLVDKLTPENNFVLDKAVVPTKKYPEKKYSKAKHVFNLHSWGLTAVDMNNYSFTPGVAVLTQNDLSTAYGSLGYYYDPNEMTGKTKLSFIYAGWYPKISLSADYGLRRSDYIDENNTKYNVKWMETNLSLRFSVPLNFTKSKWVMGLTPYIGGTQKFRNIIVDVPVKFTEDIITSLSYGISAYVQLKRSIRDIYPKWGYSVNLLFKHTPFSASVSEVYGISQTIYLPGLFNHNGIRIYGAYQYLNNGNYSYSNVISSPRGYTGLYFTNMYSIKTEYALPLLYPDIDIQAVAYLKRVYAHLFYDHLLGVDGDKSDVYNSAGVELYTDWNFLSLMPNVKLGLRSSYLFKTSTINNEFLFGFSF